jgi:thiol:disulfide interchange protein
MKSRLVFSLLFISFCVSSFSQIQKHVFLSYAKSKPDYKQGDTVDIFINAKIDDGWYLYSTEFKADGPLVFEAEFKPSDDYKPVGKLQPFKPFPHYDSTWEGEVKIFEKFAQFKQPVIVNKAGKVIIKASIRGQYCSDACIQLDEKPTLDLSSLPVSRDSAVDQGVYDHYNAHGAVEEKKEEGKKENVKPKEETGDKSPGKESLWYLLFLAFTGGLIALATPCVFPMIPMTVSFFTKQEDAKKGRRDAVIFGISIILIYTLVGVICSLAFGKDFALVLSTHWLPNVIFFMVFIIFGVSFLGMFELVLPASFTTRIDRMSEKGGMIGIFFMALTLVVVSFSCTAPVASSILILASQGNFIKAVPAMLVFSATIAIPFMLFAFFPGWMRNLPKSGGWLNSVKVVLGFIEIAFAFKFLSVADLAYHWHILDRDVYLIVWIVLSFLLGMYLLGKLHFPHDSKTEHVPVSRFLISVIFFCFSIYMIPGLWGAPLKFLAGYVPPQSTLDFDLYSAVRILETTNATGKDTDDRGTVKYSDFLHQPAGIRGFFDLNEGIAYAKKKNKPVFLDFTGHGCTNCRKMEDNVWIDKDVFSMLQNNYVVISLFYDEKTNLPPEERYKGDDGEEKTTVGDKNLDFQAKYFNSNAAPLYVIIGNDSFKPLLPPRGYNPDIESFRNYLADGLKKYKGDTASR